MTARKYASYTKVRSDIRGDEPVINGFVALTVEKFKPPEGFVTVSDPTGEFAATLLNCEIDDYGPYYGLIRVEALIDTA